MQSDTIETSMSDVSFCRPSEITAIIHMAKLITSNRMTQDKNILVN